MFAAVVDHEKKLTGRVVHQPAAYGRAKSLVVGVERRNPLRVAVGLRGITMGLD
jgi:hypothetical protein